jgi:hypothetical protein
VVNAKKLLASASAPVRLIVRPALLGTGNADGFALDSFAGAPIKEFFSLGVGYGRLLANLSQQ